MDEGSSYPRLSHWLLVLFFAPWSHSLLLNSHTSPHVSQLSVLCDSSSPSQHSNTAQLSVRGLCLWNLPLAVPACRELRPRAFVKQAHSNAFVGLGKVPHLTLSCGGMWQPACRRVVQQWSTSKADMVNYFCKALREWACWALWSDLQAAPALVLVARK